MFSVCVRQKVIITENITFSESVSGIRPLDCSKLVKNPNNDNDITIFWHDVNIKIFFWRYFVSLVKFSYWSKFHVNIITSSGIKTIFFYKGLTRNLEIRNTSVWVLPNIWRLGRVMDTKFGMNVSNRMLLNAAKFQGYSSYRFLVIKRKSTGGGVKLPLPPTTQIRVKCSFYWKMEILKLRYVLAKLPKFVQIRTLTSSDSFLQRILWKLKGIRN